MAVEDQFGGEKLKLRAPKWLCVPTSKKIGAATTPSRHPVQHLVCYEAKGAESRAKVEIRNQLESEQIKVGLRTNVGYAVERS